MIPPGTLKLFDICVNMVGEGCGILPEMFLLDSFYIFLIMALAKQYLSYRWSGWLGLREVELRGPSTDSKLIQSRAQAIG